MPHCGSLVLVAGTYMGSEKSYYRAHGSPLQLLVAAAAFLGSKPVRLGRCAWRRYLARGQQLACGSTWRHNSSPFGQNSPRWQHCDKREMCGAAIRGVVVGACLPSSRSWGLGASLGQRPLAQHHCQSSPLIASSVTCPFPFHSPRRPPSLQHTANPVFIVPQLDRHKQPFIALFPTPHARIARTSPHKQPALIARQDATTREVSGPQPLEPVRTHQRPPATAGPPHATTAAAAAPTAQSPAPSLC